MMKAQLLCGLLFLFLMLPVGAAAKQSFSNLVVFGDSLSDTGNLAALPGFEYLNGPPFAKGFSNGELAVEGLAKSLGLAANPSLYLTGLPLAGTNYAVAAARARGTAPIDLANQIGSFLLSNGGKAPSDALYIVFIGGSDVRDARDQPDDQLAKTLVKRAVDAIDSSLRKLVAAGAKAIIVINAPDIGAIPETYLLGDKKFSERASRLTKRFNKELSRRVRRVEFYYDLDLIEFDVFSFFQLIVRNHRALGFTNNKDACFSSATFTFHPECNFARFVYFDEIHPTKRAHERVGRALYAVSPEFVGGAS